jgi:broad specificity phosphatase PhoE
LVRHAESLSNAGLPTEAPGTYPITDVGRAAAQRFADAWGSPPQLVVTSPYLRTQETAAPFRARFPDIPHETWEVQEWTFLDPSKYKGSTYESRKPHAQAFWERNDPRYRDGGISESFLDLLGRVGRVLTLAKDRTEGDIVIFTHGHFMRVVIWSILSPTAAPPEMLRFRRFTEAVGISNLAVLDLYFDTQWYVRELPH